MPPPSLNIDLWALKPDECGLEPFPVDMAAVENIDDRDARIRRARSKSLLRYVISQRISVLPEQIIFAVSSNGKPSVSGCEFSVSHSGSWLVIALAEAPIGVDVETNRPRHEVLDLAARFFHPADTAALRASPAEARGRAFLGQWTAKEAALKAAGTGIGGHLHMARCESDGFAIRTVACGRARYAICEFVLRDGTPGAVACDEKHGQPALAWRAAVPGLS